MPRLVRGLPASVLDLGDGKRDIFIDLNRL